MKPAHLVSVDGNRYLTRHKDHVMGNWKPVSRLARFMEVLNLVICIGLLAFLLFVHLPSHLDAPLTPIVLIGGVGFGLVGNALWMKNSREERAQLIKEHERRFVEAGDLVKVSDEDRVLSHAYDTLSDLSAGEEELDQAQRVVNLAVHAVYCGELIETMKRKAQTTPGQREALVRIGIPTMTRLYEQVQGDYLRTRLDYALPDETGSE